MAGFELIEESCLLQQRERVVVGGAQQAHDAGSLVASQRDKGRGVQVELAGAAQALEAVEQDPRAGQLDALKRFLDPRLGDGS